MEFPFRKGQKYKNIGTKKSSPGVFYAGEKNWGLNAI